jgi:hypothetical protein
MESDMRLLQRTMGRINPALPAVLAGVTILSITLPAKADITLTEGNIPPFEVINLNNGQNPGSTLLGTVDTTTVFFSTVTGQTLFEQGMGQASITSAAAVKDSALTSMDINITTGNTVLGTPVSATEGFSKLIFDPNGGSSNSGTATINAWSGATEFTFNNVPVGNGSNFVTLQGINNELITDVQIVMNGADTFSEFKQPRMFGIEACQPGLPGCSNETPAPGPTPGAGLLGLAFLALAGWMTRLRRSLLGGLPRDPTL